jgi:hypothetical protein
LRERFNRRVTKSASSTQWSVHGDMAHSSPTRIGSLLGDHARSSLVPFKSADVAVAQSVLKPMTTLPARASSTAQPWAHFVINRAPSDILEKLGASRLLKAALE